MPFILKFTTYNAAFEENVFQESARILREVANKLEKKEELSGTIRDINGNEIGGFVLR
jgi:hypothetical protein